MGAVEWNKKEDLLGDQALRHLTVRLKYSCDIYHFISILDVVWSL